MKRNIVTNLIKYINKTNFTKIAKKFIGEDESEINVAEIFFKICYTNDLEDLSFSSIKLEEGKKQILDILNDFFFLNEDKTSALLGSVTIKEVKFYIGFSFDDEEYYKIIQIATFSDEKIDKENKFTYSIYDEKTID